MSPKKPNHIARDADYLDDIVEAANELERLMGGLDRDQFARSPLHQYAAYHLVTVIGEAARSLSADLRERHPEIPWKDIVGMRNLLVHRYHRVDESRVWKTIRTDVPVLAEQVGAIARELAGATDPEPGLPSEGSD